MAAATIVRLIGAAAVAGAVAGLALSLLAIVEIGIAGADRSWRMLDGVPAALPMLSYILPVALFLGAIVGGVPALLAGGLLWAAAQRRAWARSGTAWALAGAIVGFAFPLLVRSVLSGGLPPQTLASLVFCAGAFAPAGALGAIAFRKVMISTG